MDRRFFLTTISAMFIACCQSHGGNGNASDAAHISVTERKTSSDWQQFFEDVVASPTDNSSQTYNIILTEPPNYPETKAPTESDRRPVKVCNATYGNNASITIDCKSEQRPICQFLDTNVSLYGGAFPDQGRGIQASPKIMVPPHPKHPNLDQFDIQIEWENLDPREYAEIVRDHFYYAGTVNENDRVKAWQDTGPRLRHILMTEPERITLQGTDITDNPKSEPKKRILYRIAIDHKQTYQLDGQMRPNYYEYLFYDEVPDFRQKSYQDTPLLRLGSFEGLLISFDENLYAQSASGGANGYIKPLTGALTSCVVKEIQ